MRIRDGNRRRLSRSPVKGESVRLFFALWPDAGVRSALAAAADELCRQCGGRAIRAPNIHLTLAFLGEVPIERMPEVRKAAGAIEVPRFELAIDGHGYWRHNRIVWAGTRKCPAALRDLAMQLGQALQALGYAEDTRDYAPHVTLVREARRPPSLPMTASIAWPATAFVLVQSLRREGAVAYEVLRRWPLMPLV